jgi:hypothetical protein
MLIYTFFHISPGFHKKTMGDGEKLLTYLNSVLKVLSGLDIFPRETKRKWNFVDQCYVKIPALRDTLAEKNVTNILKCFTISAAPCIKQIRFLFNGFICTLQLHYEHILLLLMTFEPMYGISSNLARI